MNGTRDLIRAAERAGWTVTTTNGGHLRLEHESAAMPVFAASTPSDHRALHNTLATMRRALPPTEPKAPKVERKRLPPKKRKPAPKPTRTEVGQAIDWQAPPEPWGVGGSAPRCPPRPRPPLPGAPGGIFTTRWP